MTPRPHTEPQDRGKQQGEAGLSFPSWRAAAYDINSGISSPCGEKGGAQREGRRKKGMGGWDAAVGEPGGCFCPHGGAQCWGEPCLDARPHQSLCWPHSLGRGGREG